MIIRSIITGTGSFVSKQTIPNASFLEQQFYENGTLITTPPAEIIQKFDEITEIRERRYAPKEMVASDIGYIAAQKAITSSGIDPETIDYIIVAHNFGDVAFDNRRSTMVPSLAARIKHKLGIRNPNCVAQDITFGCPGWIQGIIMADALIKSGFAKRILIIGTETLSRISDPHDRDSLIYADGAGAAILEAKECDTPVGIISHAVRSDTLEHAHMLRMDVSYNPNYKDNTLFLKMNGSQLFRYAMEFVPQAIKDCMDKADVHFNQVAKFLFHQANAKMDYGFLGRLAELFGYTKDEFPENIRPKKKDYGLIGKMINLHGIRDIRPNIMPMTIHEFGNSSVATVPTLLDLLFNHQFPGRELQSGEKIVMASVGAGMNINVIIYGMP